MPWCFPLGRHRPLGVESGEFPLPRGYHHKAITQFTTTNALSFMNFPMDGAISQEMIRRRRRRYTRSK